MNRELPDVQAGFRKGRGTRDEIANIHWIIEKEKKTKHKTNIVANSIKILKTVHTKNTCKRLQCVEWKWGE